LEDKGSLAATTEDTYGPNPHSVLPLIIWWIISFNGAYHESFFLWMHIKKKKIKKKEKEKEKWEVAHLVFWQKENRAPIRRDQRIYAFNQITSNMPQDTH